MMKNRKEKKSKSFLTQALEVIPGEGIISNSEVTKIKLPDSSYMIFNSEGVTVHNSDIQNNHIDYCYLCAADWDTKKKLDKIREFVTKRFDLVGSSYDEWLDYMAQEEPF